MKNISVIYSFIICFSCLLLSFSTYNIPHKKKVFSLSALQKAINSAQPGDVINLANGSYFTTKPIIIKCKGSSKKPIIISAAQIGGTTIKGSSGFSILKPAQYVTVRGFNFKHAADSTSRIQYGASYCRFTQNIFELTGEIGSYLTVAGDYSQIDYNTFQNKSMEGRMLLIEGPGGDTIPQHVWIHHNLFKNFEYTGKNNSSAIQFGRSWSSISPAYGLIEHNLFIRSKGENENVAHKASYCIYRYNTFSQGSSELSLRHGNHNEVYGNFFLNTDGIRIFGDDHKIYNNYFQGNSRAIHIGNGQDEVADGGKLTTHDRPDRIDITFNTLVDNKINFFMGARKQGLGATGVTVANNIILGGTVEEINGSIIKSKWMNNFIWNNKQINNIHPEGYKILDPLMIPDKSGVLHLQNTSPAIDAAQGSFSYVKKDLDNEFRYTIKDVGSDEFSAMQGQGLNHPIQEDEVGSKAKI